MTISSFFRVSRFAVLAPLLLAGAVSAQVTLECEPAFPAEPEPQQAQTLPSREAVIPVRAAEGRVAEEKSGNFPVREGQRLKLSTDVGNIRVRTSEAPQVNYRVRVETLDTGVDAQKLLKQFVLTARPSPDGVVLNGSVPWGEFRGRLWVTFDVSVPRTFQLDVTTQGGNVETDSINGRIALVTAGGNLVAGEVGGPARLETQGGGHITIQDVKGDLNAYTAGGHINVGTVEGDAVVRTGGGHVRVGYIRGTAQLESGGGNIFLQKPGAYVNANTGGGRIDFGEAAGGIRARTGGGNIGILKVAGPAEIESSGGSISLTSVQGSIKASTASGPITAFLVAAGPDGKLRGPSQLASGQGDIVLFVPRELPVTIEAVIEAPLEHRIDCDPGFPMKLSVGGAGANGRPVRGEAVVNGGGEIVRLRTTSGNIRLKWALGNAVARYIPERGAATAMPFDTFYYRFEVQQKNLESSLRKQQEEAERDLVRAKVWELTEGRTSAAKIMDRMKLYWDKNSRVAVPSTEMQARLLYGPKPVYPQIARNIRLEGRVRLEITLKPTGEVERVRVVSGHQTLAPAAVEAVRQWRYAPTVFDGQPVSVVTTVDFEFRLN